MIDAVHSPAGEPSGPVIGTVTVPPSFAYLRATDETMKSSLACALKVQVAPEAVHVAERTPGGLPTTVTVTVTLTSPPLGTPETVTTPVCGPSARSPAGAAMVTSAIPPVANEPVAGATASHGGPEVANERGPQSCAS